MDESRFLPFLVVSPFFVFRDAASAHRNSHMLGNFMKVFGRVVDKGLETFRLKE